MIRKAIAALLLSVLAVSARAQGPQPPPVPIATTSIPGIVKPDGSTITVQSDGTISAPSSGGGTVNPSGTFVTNDSVCAANTAGTLIKDCGFASVATVFGRSGPNITAQSGDYSFGLISGQLNLASQVTGNLAVAHGGTGTGTASGAALDNITGFAGTGLLDRTGSGAYSFLSLPLSIANGGIGASSFAAASLPIYSGTFTLNDCVKIGATSPVTFTDAGLACGSGGGTSPGGTNGQIQYNNAGSFGGFTFSGDITVDPTTGIATIANNAVTYDKLQQVSAHSLLGNPTGSTANASEIGLGAGLTWSGTNVVTTTPFANNTVNANIASYGGMDFFNGSNLTATLQGTGSLGNGQSAMAANYNATPLTITNSQTVNGLPLPTILHSYGFYGYVGTGSNALAFGFPGFDTITANALPKFSDASGATTASSVSDAGSGVTIGSPTGGAQGAGTLNATGLYINGVAVGSGGGTVSSVGLSLPSIFSVSGSPVTGSGTLTGTLANENANTVLAGPSSGAATAPTFRALVSADLPGVGDPAAKTADYTATASDMGNALNFGTAGTTYTNGLTLPTKSSTIFAPGMTLSVLNSGASTVPLTNSTGLTLTGFNGSNFYPGMSGTFVANADGTHLDFFSGMQAPSATAMGGVQAKDCTSGGQFVQKIGTDSTVTCATPAGGGNVSTTGTPATGNLTKFSGSTTITNGDLSGDVTTSGSLVATIKSSVALAGSPTTTTQAANDNSTKIATTAYADRAASNAASAAVHNATIGWIAGVDPNNALLGIFPSASTITSIVGNVETAVGSAATVAVYIAPSGTACSSGTNTDTSATFNANGTAATNQTLTPTTTAIPAGSRLCLVTTGTTAWTSGSGIGGITVSYTTP